MASSGRIELKFFIDPVYDTCRFVVIATKIEAGEYCLYNKSSLLLIITPENVSKQPNRTEPNLLTMLRLLLLFALFFVVEPFAPVPAARSSDVYVHQGHGSSSSSSTALQDSRRHFFGACATTAATLVATTLSPSYANAKGTKGTVNFSNVKNGDTVPSKFTYKFDLTGFELSPAKDGLIEGTGHHHVIIDDNEGKGFTAKGTVIPMDATHKHYGKAQAEGEIELEPGTHKLTLQFANALHESYGKEFAKTITVTVL